MQKLTQLTLKFNDNINYQMYLFENGPLNGVCMQSVLQSGPLRAAVPAAGQADGPRDDHRIAVGCT